MRRVWIALTLAIVVAVIIFASVNARAMDPEKKAFFTGIDQTTDGKYDQAIVSLTKAIEMKPDYSEAYYYRAIAYAAKKLVGKAIMDYGKCIEYEPMNANAYYNRGFLYERNGELENALADYEKTLILTPHNASVLYSCGRVYLRRGDLKEAIRNFSEAIKLVPGSAHIYHSRAVAYYRSKDYYNSWDDVKMVKSLGVVPSPRFIDDLKSASGRER